jgi:hypothetical protein
MTEALGDAGGSAVPDPGALTVGSEVTDGSGMDLGANEPARGAEDADSHEGPVARSVGAVSGGQERLLNGVLGATA